VRGILIVGHGSRAKETEATLEAVLGMARAKLPEMIVEYGFMEFSDKTVEKAVAALIEKGVDEIKVVPYFLFMGMHLKEDIPNMVAECVEEHPDVKVIMGEPLGVDERLADILADRMRD